MEYEVGQRVIDTDGDKGVIVSIISSQLRPYGVKVEGYDLPLWYTETGIRLDEDVLQAENERLRTAIQEALQIAREGEMSLNLCEDAKSLHFEAHMILEAILNTLPESEA